jgi:hypothetical protein
VDDSWEFCPFPTATYVTTGISAHALELARRLLEREPIDLDNAEAIQVMRAGENVLQRLYTQLTLWFGTEGCNALFARAINRTQIAHPVLDQVLRRPPRAQFFEDDCDSLSPEHAALLSAGVVALIATLIMLLKRLVGDDIAIRIIAQKIQKKEAGCHAQITRGCPSE